MGSPRRRVAARGLFYSRVVSTGQGGLVPVTALEIHRRARVLDGRPFGAAGAYEKIAGVLRLAADPDHPLHTWICDLGLVARNRDGRVDFAADLYLLRTVDPARGNHRVLLDVPNRGRKVGIVM